MNRSEFRIPEEKTQEVFTLAAQLYAKHNQSYSVKELMEAGAEVKIPPVFIQEAIAQLQLQHSPSQRPTTKQSKALIGLAIALPLLAAIATAGWLLTRNPATYALQQPVQPISGQPPASDANLIASNFKCADLNLERQDLSRQNLTGVDCTGAKLAGANLRNLNLRGANLSHADLKNAKLNGANLRNADLAEANLAGADLTGADLQQANLSNTNLRGAILRNVNIRGADLAGADLDGAKK